MICCKEARRLFIINPNSPSYLLWRVKPSKFSNNIVGRPAGKKIKDGYYQVPIGGKGVHAHRVVYSAYYGEDLDDDIQIDHRDGDTSNNSPGNLRKATHSQNSMNAKVRIDNKLGVKNVYKEKNDSYTVSVQANKVRTSIYGIKTIEEAIETAKNLREKLHKEFKRD